MKLKIADILWPEVEEKLRSICEYTEAFDYDILVVRSLTAVDKELVDKSPNLKLVVRAGVGLEHIDLDYCKSKGITVKNTPLASTISVAELVMAHMLCLARDICPLTQSIKEGRWLYGKVKGFELSGKTLGIVGYGAIGKEVAKRAKAFGMDLIAYDPYLNKADIPLLTLEEVMSKADIISLHVPLTSETKGMINSSNLKKGLVIINASRGGVINEDDLYKAVQTKGVKAGLDVFAQEPPGKNKLTKSDSVSLTPHIGGSTIEAYERVSKEVINIVGEFLNLS